MSAVADPYAEVRRLGAELSNWGRWGDDDELGTLNLITPGAVARGAASVRHGVAVCLGLPLGEGGPHTGDLPGRFNPQHYMTAVGTPVPHAPFFHFSDDVVVMPLNAATQWDSLAHVHYEGRLYNGWPAAEALDQAGAHRNGIDKAATVGLATRGVLADVAGSKGVERLAPGTPVTPDDLDGALGRAGVEVLPGDVVLVRTGHLRTFTIDGDRVAYQGSSPGLGLGTARWLRERDVAAVATDTVMVEVTPSEDGTTLCPLHLVAIRDMGMLLGEMFDLEVLATTCEALGQWDFQLVATPLGFTGGICSPLNPVAVL